MKKGSLISHYDRFILDLDGTISRGECALPGAIDALHEMQRLGKQFVVLTDNSVVHRMAISAQLAAWGITIPPEAIVTSSYATARFLAEKRGSSRVFLIGEGALREELEAFHHVLVDPEEAHVLVVGFDSHLTYNTLAKGFRVLRRGGVFIATDQAPTWAAVNTVLPGVGSIVGAFRGMGYEPDQIIGKPAGVAVDMAYALVGGIKERTLLVGDALLSDVPAAQYLGIDSALVLSGVTAYDDLMSSRVRPTYIIPDVSGLFDMECTRYCPSHVWRG